MLVRAVLTIAASMAAITAAGLAVRAYLSYELRRARWM